MARIEKQGDKVTLEMTWEEYRDLCETLTAAGNEAWQHRNCQPVNELTSKFRTGHAESAWAWTNAIGFPPMLKDEVRVIEIEPFKFLSGK